MKNFMQKYYGALAAFALLVTSTVANSACIWITHQEPLPQNAKNLQFRIITSHWIKQNIECTSSEL